VIRICFHGAESTGKSAMAARLGFPWVPEFGRAYCEEHGTDLAMSDLLAIAAGQDAAMRRAAAARPELLILDTDPLMTAAWAQMLFSHVPDVLMQYEKADLYLLFEPDVPWIADGTRFFGTAQTRAEFAAIAEAVLVKAQVPVFRIRGSWEAREAQVRLAISSALTPVAGLSP
jgi:NadR type nicotinamide-nucleotide adenylyltransferase